MEREIKFRGQRVGDNEWIFGDLIHTPENKTRIIYYEDCSIDGVLDYKDYNFLIKTETLGQYTGLKDKNGVEIYEGDMIGFNLPNMPLRLRFEVVFTKGLFGIEYNAMELQLNDLENIEVIGNIHEK